MSTLGRLTTLVKSNLNDLIDQLQDPGKAVDQLISDMEDTTRKARTEVAACIAQEKLMAKRISDLEAEARSWEEQASRAVQAGNDELAKEALRRKASREADRIEAERALAEQSVQVQSLKSGLAALDARLQDVKLNQGTLRAKARAAKGQDPLSSQTSAFDEFQRMSSAIDTIEAEGTLTEELSGQSAASKAALEKLQTLSDEKNLDDELAALKKKLGG
jgi:phage shock protein A